MIRHAEPNFGEDGRICLGTKLDLPLSETGRQQASRLGEQMKEKTLDAIYVSPLLRAKQTADAFSQNCPRITVPALTEVGSGEWEGMRFSDIYTRYPEYFDFEGTGGGKTPPGGESDEAALARGLAFLDTMKASQGKSLMMITHSGFGRILLCHLLGMPLYKKRMIPMRYASCTELMLRDGIWEVRLSEELIESNVWAAAPAEAKKPGLFFAP